VDDNISGGDAIAAVLVSVLYFIWAVVTFLVGLGTFCYSWWWAFEHWGWLLGIAFGWLPALIVAVLAGALWPLGLALLALLYLSSR